MADIGAPFGSQRVPSEEAAQNAAIHHGTLFVPTAYTDAGDTANVQLNGADVACAFRLTPEVDYAITSMSEYLAAIGTTGNLTINVKAEDGSVAPDWDGDYNTSTTNALPTMSANTTGAWVCALVDSANANAETVDYEAWRAFNGLLTGNGCRSNAAPTALAPMYLWIGSATETLTINKAWLYSTAANFPKAFTFWGVPGTDAPNSTSVASWVALLGADGRAWSAEVDPGAAAMYREYAVGNNATYHYIVIKITDRVGANAYFELLEAAMVACQSKSVPGALISSISTSAVGAAAATWIRQTFTAYQLQRCKQVWFEYRGQAGKDFSIRASRNNTTVRSMFPDGVTMLSGHALIYTTDSWAHRKTVRIHKCPAMLNVVFNSTANHSPVLGFGRESGSNMYIPGTGTLSIPQAGIFADCESKTADVLYGVYLKPDGTLAIDTSDPSTSEGVEIATIDGAVSRFLGLCLPLARIGAYVAPVDCSDSRRLRDKRTTRPLIKTCPYYQYSSQVVNRNATWTPIGIAATDFQLEIVTLSGDEVFLAGSLSHGNGYVAIYNYMVDGSIDVAMSIYSAINTLVFMIEYLSPKLAKGLHTLIPVGQTSQAAGNQSISLYLGQGPGGSSVEPAIKTMYRGEIKIRRAE